MSVFGASYGRMDHPRGTSYVVDSSWGYGRAFEVCRVERRARDGYGWATKIAIFVSKTHAVRFCNALNMRRMKR